MAYISELPHTNYNITPSYIDTDSIRREMKKILANGHFGIAQLDEKGNKEMENKDRTITIETMFRTLIDSSTYVYHNVNNKGLKNDFYSTLEFIKRTLKQNAFENKEIILVKKSLDLIETVLEVYDVELNMSKPEAKSFNNILCDIKQSLSERERI